MADNITPDNESFKDQRDILKEINAELGKQIDYVKDASKLYSGLTGIAKKLQNDEESISRLNVKQLKDLKAKSLINLRDLKDAAEKLSYQNASTDAEVALLIAKENSFRVEQELVDNIGKRLEQEIKINETLGTTGALLKGMSKIPIVGNIIDTNKALDASRSKIKDGSGKFSAMGAAVKSVGADILTNLTDPLTTTVFLAKNFLDILIGADKATGELAKGMNMSYSSAASLRTELSGIAALTGDAFVNTRTLQESLIAVGQSLGANAKLNKEDLITFTKLREEAGYTNEELVNIQKLTLATGGNLKDNVKSFAGTVQLMNAQNKLSINEKQLLKEVANTSAAIKLSVGGTTESLAKSAFQAKQFGINLDQADKISQGLLNFESSIQNELEAELLTGKDLNLEKARLLALNGDIAGAGAEILKQVGGTAEFSKMNRIQQEAIASAVGLGRDELAKSLIDREALAKLGGQDVEIDGKKVTLQEYYNKLKSDGLTQDQISAKLGDESLAKQLEQTSNAEKMQASIEKLKDAFIPIAEAILPKINSALQWFSENINGIVLAIKTLGIFLGTKMLVSMTLNAFQASVIAGATTTTAIAQQLNAQATIKAAVAQGTLSAEAGVTAIAQSKAAIASLTTAGALSGGLAIPLILGAVAAAVGAFMMYESSASQKVKDGIAPSSNGPFTITDNYGATAITTKGDGIAVSPNINKGDKNIDMSGVISELSAVKAVLNQILTKEGSVKMDSTQVGTSTNVGTYKVQ